MQLGDALEQLLGLRRREADTPDVVDARAVLVDVVLAQLRDASVRAEQHQRHPRTRQPTAHAVQWPSG